MNHLISEQIKDIFKVFEPFLNTKLSIFPGIFVIAFLIATGFFLGRKLMEQFLRFLGW